MFDSKIYKFIGTTVNENDANLYKIEDPFKKILSEFNEKGSKIDALNERIALIYFSLGTVFNINLDIYKMVLGAIKSFDLYQSQIDDENKKKLRLEDLRVVVSLGEKSYNKMISEINEGKYSVHKNVMLVKTAPQIEILKRCSLFLTHNGMNSTSESIHFGGK